MMHACVYVYSAGDERGAALVVGGAGLRADVDGAQADDDGCVIHSVGRDHRLPAAGRELRQHASRLRDRHRRL